MKNKILREKIYNIVKLSAMRGLWSNPTEKILKLISKEIKKNRPKEKELSDHFKNTNEIRLTRDKIYSGFNQALSEYNKIIADTLGEGEK